MSTATRSGDRPDESRATRDERTAVVTALRLGWSMADAYHHAQTAELSERADRPAAAPAKLSNLTETPGRHRLGMYLDGVDVALTEITPATPAGRPTPSTAAARRATGAARAAGRAGRQRPPSDGGSKYVARVSRVDLP
ncbi:hypothetical protein ACIBP4_20735 [Micromonospora maritima]|uniref:Uncharacterized protein n=1 Tax=Micromonospora maritima TaxID=986711 RepID=A0ABW7ZPE4_9ACTN